MTTTPHSAQDRWRQITIPHSGCDRSPVRQLRSLLRHPGRCGNTVGTCDAVRDVLGTAPVTILPAPAVRTPPHHKYGPGPAPCSGRGPVLPRAPQGGTPGTSSRRPGPPPSRGPGPPRDPRTSLVRMPALCPGRSKIATCPVTAGAREILTCRAHGTPPRHIWRTVHPTATTTPPAGVGRTPARSPRGQG